MLITALGALITDGFGHKYILDAFYLFHTSLSCKKYRKDGFVTLFSFSLQYRKGS